MTITLNGGTGIATDTGFSCDGISFADNAPSNSLVVNSSGNVGIGTSSPARKLDVTVNDTSTAQLYLRNNNASYASGLVVYNAGGEASLFRHNGASDTSYGGANSLNVGTITNNNFAFVTNNTERMRIDSSGNLMLGYGGASPTAVTAPQGLSLASPANTALQIYLFKLTQVEAHIGFKSSTDTNLYVGTSGGGGAGGIGAYGLYQANTSTAWTAVSDERFKTELKPIENALDKIQNVRAVTGRYTYDEENGVTKRRSFLIAQDFVPALPEAVDQQDPEKLGLSYTDTIPLLVAAIKELKAELDATKAEVAALKGGQA